ncbi:MAG TPA: FAD/NAD(P)-binding protein [Rickettsiales bacterium]|nr:FAD/NAD(P)-binding protein [Rickettsiales bacterium]
MADNYDIAIVGSGLAGTATLVHELLKIADDPRATADAPVNIAMIERYPQQKFGGVAYGKTADFKEHHLNLSSKSPTIFAVENMPEGFPSFAGYIQGLADDQLGAQAKEQVLKHLQDPPRELFGQYLSHLVDLAAARAGDKANVTVRIGEALEPDVSATPRKLLVRGEDGQVETLECRKLVLATGQKEPVRHVAAQNIVDSERYAADPYSAQANAFFKEVLAEQASKKAAGEDPGSVLIMGTGLTAQDAALRLKQSGYEGKITLVSRNALEHAAYGATSTEDYLANGLAGEPRPEKIAELERKPPRFMAIVDAAKRQGADYPGSVETDIVQSMQREFALHMKKGYTSEEVLGYWERCVPDIGDVLSDDASRRLYSQYATWLNTHRVGTTPENSRILNEMRESGQLEVIAGFISTRADERMKEVDGGIEVTITPGQRTPRADGPQEAKAPLAWDADAEEGAQAVTRKFDRVISGMGYSVDYSHTQDPFWRKMIDKGLATPHRKAGDGIELAEDFTLLNARGERVEGITVAGIPAIGATMFGRTPHIEKQGNVSGGRFPPFYGNISGIASGVTVMVDGLHESLMQERAKEAALAKGVGAQAAPDLPGGAMDAVVKAAATLRGISDTQATAATRTVGGPEGRQGWEQTAETMRLRRERLGLGDDQSRTDAALPDLSTTITAPQATPEQARPAPVRS